MTSIPPELLALPPIALAAGVDLYLTLLVIGAAPTLGIWDTPLPGAFGDLEPPGVLIMVGIFYVLEFAAERFPPAALVWNAFHAIIRPVAGGLLAILLLDGQPTAVMVAGAVVGGVLASAAHAARSGAAVLRWLGAGGAAPSTLLVSLAEDVLVLGIVALTLEAPDWAAVVSLIALLAFVPRGPSLVRAFRYTIQLGIDLIFRQLRRRRWHDPDQIPRWAGNAYARGDRLGPGGALRATPVAAWRLPGAPRFAIGWIVVRGGSPVFVRRRRPRKPLRVDLGTLKAVEVNDRELFRRIDLQSERASAFILFGPSGPGTESLKAEFGLV